MRERRPVWDMTGYQWTVFFAAWLGWGFDVYDGLLFNYVSANCVPTLLHLPIGSAAAKSAAFWWTGVLTSLLLLGWAAGGVLFGRIADKIGRSRCLMLTMGLFAVGTAACALATNLWMLVLFRIVASLGIGGEWAAGSAMVAEVVPERRRVEAGALLYTSAPVGLFLATWVNYEIAGVWLKARPDLSWRFVFLSGLVPAAAALFVRKFIQEPERWRAVAHKAAAVNIGELFSPTHRRLTISGLCMAVTALVTWWGCSAFIPIVATNLAQSAARVRDMDVAATLKLVEHWKAVSTNAFNLGGLIGTLLTVPASKFLGRKWMFGIYFLASSAAIMSAFGTTMPPEQRLLMFFPIGLTVFGVFGSFTYYLPELFPTRIRGAGAGFTYNVGRVVASGGPFLVAAITSHAVDPLRAAMTAFFWIGAVPLLGIVAMPLVIETRGRELQD